jgi:hypothetical protein
MQLLQLLPQGNNNLLCQKRQESPNQSLFQRMKPSGEGHDTVASGFGVASHRISP